MVEREVKKLNVRFEAAADLMEAFPEIEEDITGRPANPQQTALAFVEALLGSQTPEEAITLSAYVLPTRHAVWWGHECLRRSPEGLPPTDGLLLELAAAWVRDPTEETRYAALDAAMDSKQKTPGVWVALGAGWSGGSMVPPNLQPVPPPPFLPPRALNAAILSVLALRPVAERRVLLKEFVQMALAVAKPS